VHMTNPDNLLEKVSDPFLLGYIHNKNLDVVSKVAPSGPFRNDAAYIVSSVNDDMIIKNGN
jgi:UDP-N-acetylglucosamine pyrophosphorylase